MVWVDGWVDIPLRAMGKESTVSWASGSLWIKQSVSVIWSVKKERSLILSIRAHYEGAEPTDSGY